VTFHVIEDDAELLPHSSDRKREREKEKREVIADGCKINSETFVQDSRTDGQTDGRVEQDGVATV